MSICVHVFYRVESIPDGCVAWLLEAFPESLEDARKVARRLCALYEPGTTVRILEETMRFNEAGLSCGGTRREVTRMRCGLRGGKEVAR